MLCSHFSKMLDQIHFFVQNQPSNDWTLWGLESGCIKYIKATDAGVAQFHLGATTVAAWAGGQMLLRCSDTTSRSIYGVNILQAETTYSANILWAGDYIRCYGSIATMLRAIILPKWYITYNTTVHCSATYDATILRCCNTKGDIRQQVNRKGRLGPSWLRAMQCGADFLGHNWLIGVECKYPPQSRIQLGSHVGEDFMWVQWVSSGLGGCWGQSGELYS